MSYSQYDSEGANEISRFRPGSMWFYTGLRPATPEKVRKYDRLIFDLTYNDWTGDRDPFNVKWNSIGFNTNLMFDIPIAKKNLVSFGIGAAYGFENFVHNEVVANDTTGNNYTLFSDQLTLSNDWTTSFSAHNFSVPIEFRFRTKGWKHFKVHIGGRVGYRANVIHRSKFDDGEEKYVVRYKTLNDVNHLVYSAHVRIGIRNWALYGSYTFSPLFKSKESIQLYPLQFGLSVSLF